MNGDIKGVYDYDMARNLEVNNQENDDDTNSTSSSSDNETSDEEDDSDSHDDDEIPDVMPRTTRCQEELERMQNNEEIEQNDGVHIDNIETCLLYTSPSPRDQRGSRMPSSA